MNKRSKRPLPEDAPGGRAPPSDEATGLPGIRAWRTVYGIVFGIFILWLSLLTWLTRHFQP